MSFTTSGELRTYRNMTLHLKPMAVELRVVGSRPLWYVLTRLGCVENNAVLKKLNELANISFDSKFVMVFEIWPFKVAFFLFFFLQMSIFQRITWLNELCKSIALAQRWKNVICFKFQLIAGRDTEKRANLVFFLVHH